MFAGDPDKFLDNQDDEINMSFNVPLNCKVVQV